jgi:hypothetical protein
MLFLQILRGALLGGGGLALGNSIALSYGGDHKLITYVAWYGIASLLLLAGLGVWVQMHRKQPSQSGSDPCGDSADRLSQLVMGARQLAHNLANFQAWWPAIEDKGFSEKLPDGQGPTTHGEAMRTLLFMFGQFFSQAWTYQQQCRHHRHRTEVKEWVDEVFKALGNAPGGPTDATLMSSQLHAIGEQSTKGWGTAEARTITRAELKAQMSGDSQFAEDFEPLWTFLRAAGPDTEARARLKAAEESIRRVEERLIKKGYGP